MSNPKKLTVGFHPPADPASSSSTSPSSSHIRPGKHGNLVIKTTTVGIEQPSLLKMKMSTKNEDPTTLSQGETTASNTGKSPNAKTTAASGSVSPVSAKTKDAKAEMKAEMKADTKENKGMSKEEKKKLKAERRAAAIAAKGGPNQNSGGINISNPNSASNTNASAVSASFSSRPSLTHSSEIARLSSPPSRQISSVPRMDDPKHRRQKEKTIHRRPAQKPVPLFMHLTQYEKDTNLDLSYLKNAHQIHSSVIHVALKFSEFVISGGNARCLAMLSAFKKVIQDYVTPPFTTLSRHLTTHISKQVDFLSNVRSLCASMKTAIRYLKYEIGRIDINVSDEEAKTHLLNLIDNFIRDRITLADTAIVGYGLSKINHGDTILTYGKSSVVLQLLLEAKNRGIGFRVVVVDNRPRWEGKAMLSRLVAAGIPCTYIHLPSTSYILPQVTKVILGASSLLSNGAVMSRVGTSVVAMLAHNAKVPVIVCCETYKFEENVRLDAVVWNEIGDPDELLQRTPKRPTLTFSSPQPQQPETPPSSTISSVPPPPLPTSTTDKSSESPISKWREIPALKLLNLHYDVTPSQFVTVVISEVGLIPSTSVAIVVRDNLGQ